MNYFFSINILIHHNFQMVEIFLNVLKEVNYGFYSINQNYIYDNTYNLRTIFFLFNFLFQFLFRILTFLTRNAARNTGLLFN